MNEHSTTIHIASDHAGFEMKTFLKNKLIEMGHNVIDYGAHDIDSNDNYPDFILPCAQATANKGGFGIVLGGSGQGEQIIANKVDGVRAALCHDELTAQMSRRHNDANVLCLPADLVGDALMQNIVKVWLAADFEGGRHQRRVQKILDYEHSRNGRPAAGK